MNKFILGFTVFFTAIALAGTDPSDTFRLGNGSPSTDKKIIINQGTAPYPAVKWNNTSGTLQFSNDGVNFSDLGSGSGSGQGFNVLANPDFESGIVLGFTHSGGTLTAATSGANLLLGKGSAVFTASAGSQTFTSASYTVPNGLKGRPCSVGTLYLGGSANLKLQAYDGTNILGTADLPPTTTPTTVAAPFLCPSSGTFQWRVISSGSAPATAFDTAFLGQDVIQQVSQATYVGGVKLHPTCYYAISNQTSSFSDFTASPCTANTLVGAASSWTNSNGTVVFNNLPPGEYDVKFTAGCNSPNAIAPNEGWAITDGTSYGTTWNMATTVAGVYTWGCTLRSHFSYTTAGTRSFKVQGTGADGAQPMGWTVNSDGAGNTAHREVFSVYRYPSTSEQAVRPETINWRAAGALNGANNFDLGTGGVSSVEINSGVANSTSFTADPNTIAALPPCSGTNAPSDASCSTTGQLAGFGIVFNQPAAGMDKVCFTFSHYMNVGTSQVITDIFKIVQTPSNSQTILQSGTNLQQSEFRAGSTQGSNSDMIHPITLCDTLYIPSAGQTTFRLFYTQSNPSANPSLIILNGGSSTVAKVEVTPVTQNVPAPVIVYNPMSFSVEQSAAFASPGGSSPLDFDTLVFDSASGWQTGSSPFHYTIPANGAGTWHFDAGFTMSDSFGYGVSTYISISVLKNGTDVASCNNGDTQNHGIGCSVGRDIKVSVGDQIRVGLNAYFCSTDNLCHSVPSGTFLSGHMIH